MRRGRRFVLCCRRRSGREIFSYTENPQEWLAGGTGFRSYRVTSYRGSEERLAREIIWRGGGDPFACGGVVDAVSFVILEIAYEIADTAELATDDGQAASYRLVDDVVRDLTYLFRAVGQDDDIPSLSLQDAAAIYVDVAEDFRFEGTGWAGRFRGVTRHVNWVGTRQRNLWKPELTPAEVERFQRLSSQHGNPSVELRLLLDAKEASHMQDDHDGAIVLMGTAFEAGTKSAILGGCANRGVVTLTIGRGEDRAPVTEAVEHGGLTRHLMEYVTQLGGLDVKQRPEYTSWYNQAYQPRNTILHQGYRGSSAQEARAAFEATDTLLALIHRLCGA